MAAKDLLIRILADNKQAKAQIQSLDASLEKMRGSLARVGHYGAIAFAGWQIAGPVADIVRLTESMTALQARLRIATSGMRDYAEAQRGIMAITRSLGTDFSATGQLFVRTFNAIKASGGSVADALAVTETVSAALKLSGASAQESASAMLQFSQAMGAGVLRGEELNAVMEAAPSLAQALSDGLGVPIGQLKILGEQGVLTSAMVRKALQEQADEIKKQAASMPTTIGQGFNAFQASMAQFLAAADQALGVTRAIGEAFRFMAENIAPVAALLSGLLAAALIGIGRQALAAAAALMAKARASQAAASAAGKNAAAMAAEAAAAGRLAAASTAATAGAAAAGAGAAAAAAKVGIFSRALAFIGGPAGLAVSALIGLGAWFISAGKKAEEGAKQIREAADKIAESRGLIAKRYRPGKAEELEGQIEAERDALDKMLAAPPKAAPTLKAGAFANTAFKAQVALANAEINEYNAKIAAQKRLIAELEKNADAARSAPRTGAQLDLAIAKVDGFLQQYQDRKEKLAAEVAEFRKLAKEAGLDDKAIAAGEAKIRAAARQKTARKSDPLAGIIGQTETAKLKEYEQTVAALYQRWQQGAMSAKQYGEAVQVVVDRTFGDKIAKARAEEEASVRAVAAAEAEAFDEAMAAEDERIRKETELKLAQRDFVEGLEQEAFLADLSNDARETALLLLEAEKLGIADVNRLLELQGQIRQANADKEAAEELQRQQDDLYESVQQGVQRAFADGLNAVATGAGGFREALSNLVGMIRNALSNALAASLTDSFLGMLGGKEGVLNLGGMFGLGGGKKGDTAANPVYVKDVNQAAGLLGGDGESGGLFGGLGESFQNMFSGIGSMLSNLFSGLMSGLTSMLSGLGGGMSSLFSGIGGLFGFADGGYTGAGGKYQPAGVVHAGEYVFSAESVRRLGLGALDNLHRIAKGSFVPSMPRFGYAEGGLVNLPGSAPPTVNASTKVVNMFDLDSAFAEYLNTRHGERAILNVIQRNPNAARG